MQPPAGCAFAMVVRGKVHSKTARVDRQWGRVFHARRDEENGG